MRRVLVVSLFNWAVIFGLFLWSEQHGNDLALARTMAIQGLVLAHLVYLSRISHWRHTRLRWSALRGAPAVPLGLAATLIVQTLFSQSSWMNRFFGTSPLHLEQLAICALPMLLMLPVAALAEKLDPIGSQGMDKVSMMEA